MPDAPQAPGHAESVVLQEEPDIGVPSIAGTGLESVPPANHSLPPAVRDGFLVSPPPRRRARNRRRFARKIAVPPGGSAKLWTRRIFAWLGLMLFAGCLFTLLNGGALPEWHLASKEPLVAGAAVAVVIDPGHGGWDTGAVAQGVREKDLNLDVGLRVSHVLEARGVRTKLTREDDHFVPLADRVELGNSLPGAVFVSIHFNDAPSEGHGVSRANGIETFYSEVKEASAADAWTLASLFRGKDAAIPARMDAAQSVRDGKDLADSIQSSLISGTAAVDRGIKERGLYVTRRVQGPAVLVEGGFVSHPAEARLLGDPNYRQRLAESIADGIVKYLAGTRHQADSPPLAVTRSGVE